MQIVADILIGRQVAPWVVLKIVPSTEEIWNQCLEQGIIAIFKKAGALVGNAGCAGCAAGQIGQNGPGEVTVSTGNRNFVGKQGQGDVYITSPAIAAASAVSGYITTPDDIPDKPVEFSVVGTRRTETKIQRKIEGHKDVAVEGRVWVIQKDDIDTDMIFHNSYLTITDINEMGKYTFDNLEGWKDFANKARRGDIIVTGKNFGSGSSRQQAVDCFKSLGIQAVIAESFGAIYERNAINAAFPILTSENLDSLGLKDGDRVRIDFEKGIITNLENNTPLNIVRFSDVQMEIYKRGGLMN